MAAETQCTCVTRGGFAGGPDAFKELCNGAPYRRGIALLFGTKWRSAIGDTGGTYENRG